LQNLNRQNRQNRKQTKHMENENFALAAEEPKTGKFQKWKYYADIAKWIINIVGVVIDSVKSNPFPKKDDYTTV
jgi:hypothetical protein